MRFCQNVHFAQLRFTGNDCSILEFQNLPLVHRQMGFLVWRFWLVEKYIVKIWLTKKLGILNIVVLLPFCYHVTTLLPFCYHVTNLLPLSYHLVTILSYHFFKLVNCAPLCDSICSSILQICLKCLKLSHNLPILRFYSLFFVVSWTGL